ncbi:Alpha/beta-Hydrolases superfamily protein, partial [Thalictrum thalictroides]
ESEGSFEYGNYQREADDLRSVIQYFCERNHAITTILGHSKGGNVVLLYASKYHDVPTIINVAGRYDPKKGIAERLGKDFMEVIKRDGFIDVVSKKGQYRVTEESLMERLSTDMHSACLSIEKGCRVLTVHGSSDEVINVEDAFAFAKIIPNHKIHIIEGADHKFSKHQAELVEVVLNFIKTFIQEGKELFWIRSVQIYNNVVLPGADYSSQDFIDMQTTLDSISADNNVVVPSLR